MTVAAWDEHSGPWGGGLWEIEVAGEVEARAGFEEDLFDEITGCLEGPGDFRVERGAFWETADAIEEEGSAFGLPLGAGCFAWDGFIQFG